MLTPASVEQKLNIITTITYKMVWVKDNWSTGQRTKRRVTELPVGACGRQ